MTAASTRRKVRYLGNEPLTLQLATSTVYYLRPSDTWQEIANEDAELFADLAQFEIRTDEEPPPNV